MAKFRSIFPIVLKGLLGIIFIVSAILKIFDMDKFEIYIYSYHFFSLNVSFLVARAAIILHLQAIDVPVAVADRGLHAPVRRVLLVLLHVRPAGMDGLVDEGIAVQAFDDVDLAGPRPLAPLRVRLVAQHPECRPRPLLVILELDADFEGWTASIIRMASESTGGWVQP